MRLPGATGFRKASRGFQRSNGVFHRRFHVGNVRRQPLADSSKLLDQSKELRLHRSALHQGFAAPVLPGFISGNYLDRRLLKQPFENLSLFQVQSDAAGVQARTVPAERFLIKFCQCIHVSLFSELPGESRLRKYNFHKIY
jgi:hypothetical protein